MLWLEQINTISVHFEFSKKNRLYETNVQSYLEVFVIGDTDKATDRSCCIFLHTMSYLFRVAPVDDDAALGSDGHLAARPGCGPGPCWGQLAPRECVQVKGIHIVVIDVISGYIEVAQTKRQ